MRTLLKALLFGICMATGCSTVGCCGAVAANSAEQNALKDEQCAAEADTAAVQGSASGSFSDTGNKVNATISSATVSVSVGSGSSGTGTSTQITMSSTGAVFSTPTGATSNGLEVTINLPSTPSNGTFTNSSSGATGDVTIGYSTANGGDSYSSDSGNGSTTGTWSLTISSQSQICSISTTTSSEGFYKIHGTLTATMPDDNSPPGSGSLSLTF